MGEVSFPQEVIERILEFADGQTLLTCQDVSPEFLSAVKYLGKSKNIWRKCYEKERENRYPYCEISKLHPHNEGFQHPQNWGLIYESSFLGNLISGEPECHLKEFKICKEYSCILDLETHDDLILVLVKYNKNFAIYHRIITVNLNGIKVDKSSRFYAEMLYITPVEDPSDIRRDAIILSCDLCQLVAVPVCADVSVPGFPKFNKRDKYLTVEQSSGEILWINEFGKLITKGKCFHTGTSAQEEEVHLKDAKTLKTSQGYITLFISCGKTNKEINTFRYLRSNVTASKIYADVLIIGTDTGTLYAYKLENESALITLNLNDYIWSFNVCCNSILNITVMELKNQFVIVCCSEKNVYLVLIERCLKNFH